MRQVCRWFFAVLLVLPAVAPAAQPEALRSPRVGVLCDRYFCADSRGISRPLTEQYLGRTVAKRLFSQGDFDLTQFTFANGIFAIPASVCAGWLATTAPTVNTAVPFRQNIRCCCFPAEFNRADPIAGYRSLMTASRIS